MIESMKCFGGYSGPFCEACPIGTYKYDYSYAVCQPCQNKPLNSFYNKKGQSTSECSYQCSPGLEHVKNNPECFSAIQLQVQRVGGVSVTLSVFGIFLGIVLVIWIILIIHSRAIQKKKNRFKKSVYDGVLFTESEEFQVNDSAVTARNMAMKDSDIWSHTARMYLIGENSISFPWYIPKDFPARALDPHSKDKFLRFVK